MNLSGANEKNNFYFGLQRFDTDGISQMRHNEEKDRYRNNSFIAKYGRKFSEQLAFESNVRIAETYMQYDKETDTATALLLLHCLSGNPLSSDAVRPDSLKASAWSRLFGKGRR